MRKLTKEEHYQAYMSEEFELDGVKYSMIEEDEDMDGNFKNLTYIFKGDDDSHVMIYITLIRYGYENYGYEADYQEFDVYEVVKKEVVTMEWVTVK